MNATIEKPPTVQPEQYTGSALVIDLTSPESTIELSTPSLEQTRNLGSTALLSMDIPFHQVISSPLPEAKPEGETLGQKRESFIRELLDNGLVTQELIDSGALDEFEVNEDYQSDGLIHFLVGDDEGKGCHHLRTVLELGVKGKEIASNIQEAPAEEGGRGKTTAQLRKRQKERPSGVYAVRHLDTIDSQGNRKAKTGSTMFPNEWSTQQVIEAVLQTAGTPGEIKDDYSIHKAEIGGVLMRVTKDAETNKIITAYPEYK